MIREAIATGDTVEQAFEKACAELGVESHEAEFEILEMPVKKTFGLFGGSPAKVRAFVRSSPAESAAEYLKTVVRAMGLTDIEVTIQEEENGALLSLTGEDIGFIIVHRGETLEVLGRKMAAKALKTGRNCSLEPMNPYERRIIHTAVQEVEGAKSWSEGEDMARHVVIGPEEGERPQRRSHNNYRGGNRSRGGQKGGNRRNHNGGKPRNEATGRPAGTAPRRDSGDAPLYGRIDRKG